jgi:hypothetical protein
MDYDYHTKQIQSSNPDVGWALPTNWILRFTDDLISKLIDRPQHLKHLSNSRTWAVPTLQKILFSCA